MIDRPLKPIKKLHIRILIFRVKELVATMLHPLVISINPRTIPSRRS
ncbi:hypothetical protein GCM10008908_09730 [Clostridium subterminale]|uniref:Uncharacterized protein n=1 Tax=Clostridium subterminale TaxID=1550 RepID=A0ABP3VX06_CLOSU